MYIIPWSVRGKILFWFLKGAIYNFNVLLSEPSWINLKRQWMLWQRKLTLLLLKAFDDFCSFSTLCLWPSKQCGFIFLGLQFLVFAGKIGQDYFNAIIPEHLEYYNTCGSWDYEAAFLDRFGDDFLVFVGLFAGSTGVFNSLGKAHAKTSEL